MGSAGVNESASSRKRLGGSRDLKDGLKYLSGSSERFWFLINETATLLAVSDGELRHSCAWVKVESGRLKLAIRGMVLSQHRSRNQTARGGIVISERSFPINTLTTLKD